VYVIASTAVIPVFGTNTSVPSGVLPASLAGHAAGTPPPPTIPPLFPLPPFDVPDPVPAVLVDPPVTADPPFATDPPDPLAPPAPVGELQPIKSSAHSKTKAVRNVIASFASPHRRNDASVPRKAAPAKPLASRDSAPCCNNCSLSSDAE
jgi:hypothetical protein